MAFLAPLAAALPALGGAGTAAGAGAAGAGAAGAGAGLGSLGLGATGAGAGLMDSLGAEAASAGAASPGLLGSLAGPAMSGMKSLSSQMEGPLMSSLVPKLMGQGGNPPAPIQFPQLPKSQGQPIAPVTARPVGITGPLNSGVGGAGLSPQLMKLIQMLSQGGGGMAA